ncbi:MAG: DUF3482 domain-containing protein [Rhodocyclaceae bacterium]|nr:DUF3482 domain-containing protein [Rhodocyclaceae bacterium]
MSDQRPINLSLISHTNVGKTTLARTLLGYDVGEVQDETHTTTEATPYPLVDSPEGDVLLLWDTPGFGNSARLLKRLKQQGNPLGWFLAEVWDRYRDRPFWLTQLAVRNVRDQADVILYLVNASEQPEDAGYLAPELALLEWAAKPVIVLLNQTGQPRPPAEEQAEVARWRNALQQWPHVKSVQSLDAFTRCWIQELVLFAEIARVLPEDRRSAFERLAKVWEARRLAQFSAAMAALAQPIARAACSRSLMPAKSLLARLGEFLGFSQDEARQALADAVRSMGEPLESDLRECTERLISIHDLKGSAADVVRTRLSDVAASKTPMDPGKAAAVLGVLSGALGGLKADLLAGGMTFGGGMLIGAVIGALGGAGVAQGINVVRGTTEVALRWDDAFLDGLVIAALMRYLAVAHFGRGRGDWHDREHPPFWFALVSKAVADRKMRLAAVWKLRDTDCSSERIGTELTPVLEDISHALLKNLHPDGEDKPVSDVSPHIRNTQ